MKRLLAVLLLVAATTPAAAVPASPPGYAQAVRETVWVQSSDDQDHDGTLDLLATDVIRPAATRTGARAAVVYEASPYYGTLGRGAEGQDKAEGAVPQRFPLVYDNLLVPLGYAVVLQDSRGTRASQGCPDLLGPREVRDSVATVRWLTGHGRAFHADGSPAPATWSSGHVAMTGKSYDGTLALATATTGVPGLDTVIPISALSSYYDYTAEAGLAERNRLATPRAYVPAAPVHGAPPHPAACRRDATALVTAASRTGGAVGPFDDARDWVAHAGRIRASVWLVHGLYDDNVRVDQATREWRALQAAGVRSRLWLHQAGHADPFDVRRAEWLRDLPRWLDAELRGGPRDTGPAVQVEQTPGHWVSSAAWPARGAATAALPLPSLTSAASVAFTDAPDLGRSDAVVASADPSRVVLRTAPLRAPLHLSGDLSARLAVSVRGRSAPLSAYLVEEAPGGRVDAVDAADGEGGIALAAHRTCVGQGTSTDTGCFRDASERLVRGERRTVSEGHRLVAGGRSTVTVALQPVDVVVPAGHVLVLVLAGTEAERFVPAASGAGRVVIGVGGSSLLLPAVGGPAALARSTRTGG